MRFCMQLFELLSKLRVPFCLSNCANLAEQYVDLGIGREGMKYVRWEELHGRELRRTSPKIHVYYRSPRIRCLIQWNCYSFQLIRIGNLWIIVENLSSEDHDERLYSILLKRRVSVRRNGQTMKRQQYESTGCRLRTYESIQDSISWIRKRFP